MPTYGTQQIVQNTGSVERVQEMLQQQMDTHQKRLHQQRKKVEEKKRSAVEKLEPRDQITIQAERDAKDGKGGKKRGRGRGGDESADESPERARLDITV